MDCHILFSKAVKSAFSERWSCFYKCLVICSGHRKKKTNNNGKAGNTVPVSWNVLLFLVQRYSLLVTLYAYVRLCGGGQIQQWFSNGVPRAAASRSPGNWFEKLIWDLFSKPTRYETESVAFKPCVLSIPPALVKHANIWESMTQDQTIGDVWPELKQYLAILLPELKKSEVSR